jgi:hypothetical protein
MPLAKLVVVRHIGPEEELFCAKEGIATHEGCRISLNCRIGIKHPEILDGMPGKIGVPLSRPHLIRLKEFLDSVYKKGTINTPIKRHLVM